MVGEDIVEKPVCFASWIHEESSEQLATIEMLLINYEAQIILTTTTWSHSDYFWSFQFQRKYPQVQRILQESFPPGPQVKLRYEFISQDSRQVIIVDNVLVTGHQDLPCQLVDNVTLESVIPPGLALQIVLHWPGLTEDGGNPVVLQEEDGVDDEEARLLRTPHIPSHQVILAITGQHCVQVSMSPGW